MQRFKIIKTGLRKTAFVIAILLFLQDRSVYASSAEVQNLEKEYDEVQDTIDGELSNNEFNFKEFVNDLVTGKEKFSFTDIIIKIKDGFVAEMKNNTSNLRAVIAIAIIAAIFTNLSHAFKNNQVADTGFYITYLLLFTILATSFVTASTIAAGTLNSIFNFMKILMPTYIISLSFSSGVTSAQMYYQSSLFLISFIDLILLKLVVPMINIHFIITIANNLSKEDMLSKLSELLSDGVKWILKTLLAVVIGLNATQGLISPVADALKKSGLIKTAEAIPGVGNVLSGVAESVIGAGVLLKNAIGVAGVIVIAVICAVPLIKLGVITLVYRVSGAVVQPISDKRLINCISTTARASGLLLNTVFVALVLFVLTIIIIAVSTT